jgi:hypothetical protein
MGSLALAYPVDAFPFDERGADRWKPAVDEWLHDVAAGIYASVRFPFAVIGHEVDAPREWEMVRSGGVPDKRWDGYLVEHDGTLVWYPANQPSSDSLGWRIRLNQLGIKTKQTVRKLRRILHPPRPLE